MTEKKLPQAGEFWGVKGMQRAALRVIGFDDGECVVRKRDGTLSTFDRANWAEDGKGWEHLPWCKSFDDVEPVAEVFPQYWSVVDEKRNCTLAFHRRDSQERCVRVHKDGTEELWVYAWSSRETPGLFLRLTESEALARLTPKCPDASGDNKDTVVDDDRDVLSLVATPTAISVNGHLIGRITGIEFGILSPEVKTKIPAVRQHIGVTVENCQVVDINKCPDCGELAGDGHADVCPMAWVTQDRVPVRLCDKINWDGGMRWSPVMEPGLVFQSQYRHGYDSDGKPRLGGNTLHVRCRRKDLPPLPETVKEPRRIPLRVYVHRDVIDALSDNFSLRVTRGNDVDPEFYIEVHGLNVYVEVPPKK